MGIDFLALGGGLIWGQLARYLKDNAAMSEGQLNQITFPKLGFRLCLPVL